MQIILIVTQVLHVLSGVFWAGTTFALARMSSDQTTQMFTFSWLMLTRAWVKRRMLNGKMQKPDD